jgi:hypothetical protein
MTGGKDPEGPDHRSMIASVLCADPESFRPTGEGGRAIDGGRVVSLEDFRERMRKEERAEIDARIIARVDHLGKDR